MDPGKFNTSCFIAFHPNNTDILEYSTTMTNIKVFTDFYAFK